MQTFMIKEIGGAMVEREPTDGKWYVGMDANYWGPGQDKDGAIGKFDAEAGGFYDEDSDTPESMESYDYLAEQY